MNRHPLDGNAIAADRHYGDGPEMQVWFAWKPVRCFDGRLAWFRKVYRQHCLIHGYLDNRGPDQWWMYAIAEVQP